MAVVATAEAKVVAKVEEEMVEAVMAVGKVVAKEEAKEEAEMAVDSVGSCSVRAVEKLQLPYSPCNRCPGGTSARSHTVPVPSQARHLRISHCWLE